MYRILLAAILMNLCIEACNAQHSDVDSLKVAILSLKVEVQDIQMNLAKSEAKFKRGIFVATLGYSIVISGGLLLGRKRDDLGKALLVAGGATGVAGTVLLVDSFKYLGRPLKRSNKVP